MTWMIDGRRRIEDAAGSLLGGGEGGGASEQKLLFFFFSFCRRILKGIGHSPRSDATYAEIEGFVAQAGFGGAGGHVTVRKEGRGCAIVKATEAPVDGNGGDIDAASPPPYTVM